MPVGFATLRGIDAGHRSLLAPVLDGVRRGLRLDRQRNFGRLWALVQWMRSVYGARFSDPGERARRWHVLHEIAQRDVAHVSWRHEEVLFQLIKVVFLA